jgi:uncharacterized Ntn-hydrolase superfamily protein
VAVASKFLAVGSIVPWTEPGAGAVATQALANATFGRRGLGLMRDGLSAEAALARLLADDPGREQRQVGLAALDDSSAAHTGTQCHAWGGHRAGEGFACQGNLLSGPDVVEAMVSAFLTTAGTLQQRLFSSLQAGDRAGGDRRGRQSAALRVERPGGGYQGLSDVVADLRVDDAPEPVGELGRLLGLNDLYVGRSPQSEKLELRGAVMEELARLLARAGKRLPSLDLRDPRVRDIFEGFIGMENLEDRVDYEKLTIDRPALEFLRKTFG